MPEPPSLDPPVIGAAPKSRDARFRCGNCGAETTWDPDADALVCDYCQARVPVPRGEGTIVERALEEAGSAARGLGAEVRVARCQGCGAQVTFDERTTSKSCVFCGSARVLEQEQNRNAIRPESLIPLDVGRATVEGEFRAWLGRLWLRPSALRDTREFRAVGVYVPCWTFDCAARSRWSADAGYYYWVTEPTLVMVGGRPTMRMRQVRKVRWEPAWGERDDRFDDLIVHASKGLPEKLSLELGGFDTRALVPYRPEYLAGWRAEEYAVDLEAGWQAGQQRIVATQVERCAGDVPGDTHQNLKVENHLAQVRWKHVLLPVWSLTYSWSGRPFTVLIHGQTGKVVGEAPYSWVKILLLVLGILLAILLGLAFLSLL